MEPGVTRDLAAGQGNGLSGSHEIVMVNGGELNVWAGGTDLAFERGKKKGFQVGSDFPGTGICIALRTNHPVDLRTTTLVDATERNLQEIRRTLPGMPTPTLVVAQLCSHVGGRGPGKTLREQIENEIGISGPDPKPVVLDFEGVEQPSSSFLDEVFGRFADEHGREHYGRLLEVRNAGDLIAGMIAKVVSQRLTPPAEPSPEQSCVTPEQREAVARVSAAKAAVFFGSHDQPGLEEAWVDLFGGQSETFFRVHFSVGWQEALRSQLASSDDVVLLLPAWDASTTVQTDLLAGHSSIASAFVSVAGEFVEAGRCFELLLPTGLLAVHREVGLRNQLWELDAVRTVISFSQSLGVAGVLPQLSLSLLRLGLPRSEEEAHAVAMVNGDLLMQEGSLTKKQKRDRQKNLKPLLGVFGTGGDLGYRFSWQDPDRPLRFESYDPVVRDHEAELSAHGGTLPLRELVSAILMGSASRPQSPAANQDTTTQSAIGGRDLLSLETLALEDLDEAQVVGPVASEQQLVAGDVLVGSVRNPGGPIRIGVLPATLEGTVAKHGVYVLRFGDEAVRALVIDCLQSDFAQRWLDGEVHGLHIPLSKLQELPIPDPTGRLAMMVAQLSRTARNLRKVAADFDDRLRGLFGTLDMPLREQLANSEEASLLAGILNHGLRAVGDPIARIRLLFPLPLALAWREMELEERSRQRYDKVLHVFESTVSYLVVMLIADLREKASGLTNVGELLQGFATPGRGPTLGQWVDVLRGAPSLTPAAALEESSFPELRLLLSENQEASEWWQAVGELLGHRNDLAHRRGPSSDAQFDQKVGEIAGTLERLFSRLGFLARYSLTVVTDSTFDELSGVRQARVKELVGDHPVISEQIVSVDRELGRGLYFANARSGRVLCSPWLEYAECPECGNWEVTIPEFAAKEGRGGIHYKGLRNGHMHLARPNTHSRLSQFAGIETDA
jgi:hypothetical protein